MVSEKLQQTLEFIGASNRDISHYAKIDASLVSRVRSGSREIGINSVSISKIVNGIYLFCDDRNIIPAFCSFFGGDSMAGRERITESYIRWLFEDTKRKPKEIRIRKIPPFASNISPKLDRLMKLTDMSNIRLARTINVDSSYISRIRSGVRSPKSNIELIRNICSALAYRIAEQNKIKDAAKLMKVPDDFLKNDLDLQNELYIWLCDTNQDNFIPAAEMLLDKIESFSPDSALPLPEVFSMTEDIQNDHSVLYRGTDGLRKAVMRFLSGASADSGSELWLYSDQDMDWMVGEEEFRLKWFALMAECAKKGIRIKIIHNIDRSLSEMMAAITSWLPLYMFGTIEPYCYAKRTDDRFSHTIFLNRDKACIMASHVRGTETEGFYDYYTGSERLLFIEDEYKSLLKISKPLVTLYGGDCSAALMSDIGQAGNESIISDTLTLATMPEALLKNMLDRAGIEGDERDKAMSRWETQAAHFKSALKNGFVHEILPAFEDETVFSEGIQSDIAEGIRYTPSEFAEHIKNILRLMEQHMNYRVYILPEAPFSHIRVIVDKERVIVARMKTPHISFVFNHPLMRDAFESYILSLKDRCEQDKNAARNKLNGYL